MRIGIDARLYRSSAAGIGRYSQNLIKNLLEIDQENQYILFMTPADRQEFKLTTNNSQLTTIDIPHYSLAEQTKLPVVIAKEKLDLMHFLNFNCPVKYRGKFIVTIHDLTLLFYPEAAKKTNFLKQAAFRYVFKKACQNSSRIIAVSENTKRDIIKTFHIAPEKIAVIYEAADEKSHQDIKTEDIRTLKQTYNIKGPVILYVGQFRRHKNIDGLFRAFEIIKKDISAKLVLLGKIPADFKIDTSTGSASTLSGDKRVDNKEILRDTLMPGFVSDEELAAWYKIADVFAFPSFYEGFGLPGLEAMTCGTPVVASNTSSLPEIYQDGALYFDPSNPKEIADKIRIVLKDQKIRDQLITKGKIIVKKYSWAKTAEQTLKIYEQVNQGQ